MLTLNLIRHAKTELRSATGGDKERELAPKGVSQSNVLGKNIRIQFVELGEVHVSVAFRTQQTYSIIQQHLGTKHPFQLHNHLYLANRGQLFTFLQTLQEKTVTLVGHNEGISELATYLLGEDMELRTAEMITMTFPFSNWAMISGGTANLHSRYRPQVFLPEPVVV